MSNFLDFLFDCLFTVFFEQIESVFIIVFQILNNFQLDYCLVRGEWLGNQGEWWGWGQGGWVGEGGVRGERGGGRRGMWGRGWEGGIGCLRGFWRELNAFEGYLGCFEGVLVYFWDIWGLQWNIFVLTQRRFSISTFLEIILIFLFVLFLSTRDIH